MKKERKVLKWIGIIVLSVIVVYCTVQAILCSVEVKKAKVRLELYQANNIKLSYGNMSYIDKGEGEEILSIHGICGGYDQGYDTAVACFPDNRIIAPSRFGYLGSDEPDNPILEEQSKAFVELLDNLQIDQVYVFGTSAGGTSAIRFALDYPERTKGLILFCSAPPLMEKTGDFLEYQGPPAFLCNNYAMWLLSPMFESLMGFEADTIYGMLPMNDRKEGIILDASVSNPDMARNFDQYPLENMKVKTIIFHAKDDKLASFAAMEQAVNRFPNCIFVPFENGGHKMLGHEKEIAEALESFMKISD